MANSPAFARIKREVLGIVAAIPQGYVSTHGDIGGCLKVAPRHVAYILATLDDLDRERLPWWRVTADGGAIGRHKRREEQIARLRADGVPVADAGIVMELADRRVKDVTAPPQSPFGGSATAPVSASASPAARPARSRGIKSHTGA